MLNLVHCGNCKNISETKHPIMDLSFTMKETLEECFKEYFANEHLDTKINCEKCKKSAKAQISVALSKAPRILMIQLKRFEFPSLKKIHGSVKYPLHLDLSK
jgi:ubiquitin carboxyl-terminal hydrolase 36/42